jgi:ABC-type transport system involved in multi-copper enzyme maturation permease subunit
MFATGLTFEREPLSLGDLSSGSLLFLVLAGRLAAIAILFWLPLSWIVGDKKSPGQTPGWVKTLVKLLIIVAVVGFAAYFGAYELGTSRSGGGQYHRFIIRAQEIGLVVGGGAALLAVVLPFAANLIHCRPRRVWALAKLSFKEAIRRKVLWVFLSMLVVLLFASWFIQSNPTDQVRTYVQVVSLSMTILLLVVGALLASFGIPTDMKNQTIHTIVTKPVERFEIVLGRFLGYSALLTLVLIVVSAVSLVYVLRGVDPDAAYESLKARETMYGNLEFEGTKDPRQGVNVGKEWAYRSWINGPEPQQPTQYAVWKFNDIKGFADRKKLRCEFAFDVYRTTKGRINEGIFCTFFVHTWDYEPARKQAYDNERQKERQRPGADFDEIDDRLAEKYGCYELATKEIRNLHTYSLDIPGGLFRHAANPANPAPRLTFNSSIYGDRPPLTIKARCDSRTQYVGVARYDLFLRPDYDFGLTAQEAANRDRHRFMLNYAKGQTGIWFALVLVTALAVALSTYLSGLITFLATAAIFVGGMLREFIRSIAEGATGIVGGPFESAYRLSQRDLGAPMDETSAMKLAGYSDDVYRWLIRTFLNVLPDVDRFNFTDFVAEGYNIGGGQLGVTALMVAAYVFLCALVGYYLIKWREIASTM